MQIKNETSRATVTRRIITRSQPKEATKVVAYARVSTDKQSERGVSLEEQKQKIQGYASLYNLSIVEFVTERAASAKTLQRPGLQRALGMLGRGEVGALVVAKLDRLTRSLRDLGHLVATYFGPHSNESALLSVAEQIDTRSAGGRLVLNVLASVAEWEREAIGERTSAALRYKWANFEYTGGAAPFGYQVADDGISLVEHPVEAGIATAARELRARGFSLRQVAAHLEARAMRSRSGKPFAPTQIQRMTLCKGFT